jgi:hypothetical protein
MAVRRFTPWKWQMWAALLSGAVTGYVLWFGVADLLT